MALLREFDDDGHVVRGPFALALITIDVHRGDPPGQSQACPHEVDPHIFVLRKARALIVPGGIGDFGYAARDFREPGVDESVENFTLGVARVELVPKGFRVPCVDVVRDDVSTSRQEELGRGILSELCIHGPPQCGEEL